ncbi:MAG: hypothetical protein ACN4GK_05725, partial [Acidimicrobiia bacterium]
MAGITFSSRLRGECRVFEARGVFAVPGWPPPAASISLPPPPPASLGEEPMGVGLELRSSSHLPLLR